MSLSNSLFVHRRLLRSHNRCHHVNARVAGRLTVRGQLRRQRGDPFVLLANVLHRAHQQIRFGLVVARRGFQLRHHGFELLQAVLYLRATLLLRANVRHATVDDFLLFRLLILVLMPLQCHQWHVLLGAHARQNRLQLRLAGIIFGIVGRVRLRVVLLRVCRIEWRAQTPWTLQCQCHGRIHWHLDHGILVCVTTYQNERRLRSMVYLAVSKALMFMILKFACGRVNILRTHFWLGTRGASVGDWPLEDLLDSSAEPELTHRAHWPRINVNLTPMGFMLDLTASLEVIGTKTKIHRADSPTAARCKNDGRLVINAAA